MNATLPGVRVWDPLIRIFHWTLAVAFFSAWMLGEDGGTVHQVLGYCVLGLVAFRVVWGFIGTRYARFDSFVPTPGALAAYFKAMAARREARCLGHNPAGAAMILALLAMLLATGLTGWLQTTDAYWGSVLLDALHTLFANITLGLVGLHVAGVAYSSIRHRENLVVSMLTGRKRAGADAAPPGDAPSRP